MLLRDRAAAYASALMGGMLVAVGGRAKDRMVGRDLSARNPHNDLKQNNAR
jgi:hypothetical protein